MFLQLAKRSSRVCQQICVVIMRITPKTKDQRFWEGIKTRRSKAGLFLTIYLFLVIRTFIDFTSLFGHSLWFAFYFNDFPLQRLENG